MITVKDGHLEDEIEVTEGMEILLKVHFALLCD